MTTNIANPIINSPYDEPSLHYRFTDEGITDEVVEGRRISTYLRPVPQPRGRSKQLELNLFDEKPVENRNVNELRDQVTLWRSAGCPHASATSRRLLEYWRDPSRENRLFFCQIEAVETAIYLTEAAPNTDAGRKIINRLKDDNLTYNEALPRIAFKMATGSGKTVVMAMLIAWQVLNKRATPNDLRFTDRFLLVTPGITIRDRLRVLMPNDEGSYYRQRDIVPADLVSQLHSARIVIANYHQFQRRTLIDVSGTTKKILLQGRDENDSVFIESPEQMVRRVCDTLRGGSQIIVINDEAHHCYKDNPESKAALSKEEKAETEEARLWFNGLRAIKERLGIKAVYDLSATPFFLKGSGYGEGTIFPWVVSDFSLVDAIESGIVKVPRVPIDDNTQDPDGPINRRLWVEIKDKLPKANEKQDLNVAPSLPSELEQALWALYGDYKKRYEAWQSEGQLSQPPVMIVVCNNTTVSNLVYRWIAGWEQVMENGRLVPVQGRLDLFSNVGAKGWQAFPNTILVDSRQLESGEGMSDDFKRAAKDEIEALKAEVRRRTGSAAEELSDSDLLREVLNTVGKPGKLGENIRCVVSVSMLTEGWDANNVTHILGVRAFSTQLICEQVVGRGLRRMSYEVNAEGKFDPEYAEVFGVPFAFIPTSRASLTPKAKLPTTHVRSLPERMQIEYPRLVGYRIEMTDGPLNAVFNDTSRMTITPEEFPTRTQSAGIIGAENTLSLEMNEKRLQAVLYQLAQKVMELACRDVDGELIVWRFPEVLKIVRRWFNEGYLRTQGGAGVELLLLDQKRYEAASKISEAIKRGSIGEYQERLYPIFASDGQVGSTAGVVFDTTRPTYRTTEKSPLSYAVLDTQRWEQTVVENLEYMPEVLHYVKNYRLGLTIPYTHKGISRSYTPDFIAVLALPNGDTLNLIIEVSGEDRDDKAAKVDALKNLWLPAVNKHGTFGRWDAVEITEVYDTEQIIRGIVTGVPFSPATLI